MSAQNRAIVRRFFEEVFSGGAFDAIDELFAAEYRDHDPVNEQDTYGPDGVRDEIAAYCAGVSNMDFTIEDQFADGDRAVTRWIAHGTHDGELMGVTATGNQIEVHGTTIHRVAGGRIQEGWWNWDVLGLMGQIGALPAEQAA
jgi:steroid delta-isomerase-like uncharacterized protein